MVKDVVCGMDIESASAAGNLQYTGETYYFCSTHCLETFEKDPDQYLKPPQKDSKTEKIEQKGKSDVIYTCPMHPEVEQLGPGDCPKCGMALE